jgi:23S rRNA pseudouridine1911/1915/1917 synthase
VVDKPAGMLAHLVIASHGGTLADWVRVHCAGAAHLVGRLDRDTSGLVLVARDGAMRHRLDRQLARRGVRRSYLALVDGVPSPDRGTIDAPIGRAEDRPLRGVVPEGAPARTHYRVVEPLGSAALVELELETGRTHQIRVHLSHLGHPVLGDRWYGRRGLELIDRQALHAYRLTFVHPTSGEAVTVESPLPEDVAALLDRLRRGDR